VLQPGGAIQQQQQGFSLANPGYNQQASSSVFALPVCLLSFEKCMVCQHVFSTPN